MAKDDDIIMATAGCVGGIGLIFHGFACLKMRRIIQNTPSSTIRGGAVGIMEISGQVASYQPLTAPFSQESCIFYRYQIDEEVGSGKHKHWESFAKGDSTDTSPFLLYDQTGIIEVDPRNAQWKTRCTYSNVYDRGWFSKTELAAHIIQFMEKNKITYDLSKRLRFQEWKFNPGQKIYVLGTAKIASRNLPEIIQGLKNCGLVLGKQNDDVFFISDQDEKILIKSFYQHSFNIFLGALLFTLCSAYLLARFSLL